MVTFKCQHPEAEAEFWRQLLGYTSVKSDGADLVITHPSGEGPAFEFVQKTQASPTMNSVHIDLEPSLRDAAIERALSLGAVRTSLGRSRVGAWSVFRDPEGNEFFIEQTLASFESYVAPLAA